MLNNKSIDKVSKLPLKIWNSGILTYKPFSKFSSYLLILIFSFQTIFILFKATYLILINQQSASDSLIKGLTCFITGGNDIIDGESSILEILILTGIACYTLVFTTFLTYFIIKIAKDKKIPEPTTRLWTRFVYIHVFVLFFPIHNMLTGFISKIVSSSTYSSQTGYLISAIFALLGVVFNFIFSLIIHFWAIILKTDDPLSRFTNTYLTYDLSYRFLIPIVYRMVESLDGSLVLVWISAIINFLYLAIRTYKLYKIPYLFSKRISKLVNSFTAFGLMISIWNVIDIIVNGSEYSISPGIFITLLLLICPFAIQVYNIMIENHRSYDLNLGEIRNLKDSFKSIIALKKIIGLMNESKVDLDLKSFGEKKIKLLGYKIYKQNSEKIRDKVELTEYLFRIANINLLCPKISLTIANTMIDKFDILSRSYLICSKIMSKVSLSYSEKLTCHYIIGKIQKLLIADQDQNLDLSNFMNSINSHDKLGKHIFNQIEARDKFYSLLESENPDLQEVSQCSINIQNEQASIEKLWTSLERKTLENYPPLVKMFAYFKIFVELQIETGKELLQKYNKMMLNKNIIDQTKGKNLFTTNSIFMIVNADGPNLGKITNSTANIKKFFGYQSIELLNQNIGILMINSIASNHDAMMRDTLENTAKMVKMSTKNSFGKHKTGHIFPIQYKSTVYPSLENGLSFWGMIKPITSSAFEYIMINEYGMIEGISKMISESLNFPIGEKTNWYHIFKLYPQVGIASTANLSMGGKPTSNFATSLDMEITLKGYSKNKLIDNDNSLFEFCQQNVDIVFKAKKRVIKMGKPYKFKGKIEYKEYLGKKSFLFVLQKPLMKTKDSKKHDYSDDSEDFGIVNEYFDNEKGAQPANRVEQNNFQPEEEDNDENPDVKIIMKKSTRHLYLFDEKSGTDATENGKENKEGEDDAQLSDISEKDVDDRASMMSVSNSKLEKEFETAIENVRLGLSFYRFREAHIPFVLLILFFISFIGLIFLMYFNATQASDEVQTRLDAIRLTSSIGQDLTSALIYLYPIYLYDKIYNSPLNNNALFFLREVSAYYPRIISQNNELKMHISSLSHSEKDYFFTEDIRMYNDNFDLIPNTTTYQKVDFFTMINSIYNSATYFINNYVNVKSQPRTYAFNFLFANLMNDLWIKNINAPKVMAEAMDTSLSEIKHLSDSVYNVTLTFLGLLVLSLGIVLMKSNYETILFLRMLINHGATKELSLAIDNLRFFKGFITKIAKNSEYEAKKLAKAKYGKNERYNHKVGKSNQIIVNMLLRLGVALAFLVAPLILTWKAHSTFINVSNKIMPVVNDINKLNNITYTSIPVEGFLGMIYARPQTKVFNTNLKSIIDQSIDDARQSVSVTNNFLPETEVFLSENICTTYKPNLLYPNCTRMFQGQGVMGIRSTIIAASNYRVQYKNMITTLPITPANIFFFLGRLDYIHIGFLHIYGIAPAISAYQSKQVDELIGKLKQASSDTIVLFAPGVIFGILISVIIGYLIYNIVWRERKMDSKVLTILPIHILMNSRGIKHYLLKESKKFHHLMKKYEKLKQREDNLVNKIKNKE